MIQLIHFCIYVSFLYTYHLCIIFIYYIYISYSYVIYYLLYIIHTLFIYIFYMYVRTYLLILERARHDFPYARHNTKGIYFCRYVLFLYNTIYILCLHIIHYLYIIHYLCIIFIHISVKGLTTNFHTLDMILRIHFCTCALFPYVHCLYIIFLNIIYILFII